VSYQNANRIGIFTKGIRYVPLEPPIDELVPDPYNRNMLRMADNERKRRLMIARASSDPEEDRESVIDKEPEYPEFDREYARIARGTFLSLSHESRIHIEAIARILARARKTPEDAFLEDLIKPLLLYRAKTLNDLQSFNIQGGQSVAFVGTNGAGKSTVTKLILGLLKPSKGSVFVDGQDLQNVQLNSYYDRVAYISQDAPAFDGTLKENIVFDKKVSDSEVLSVLSKVHLRDMVDLLPDGLNSQIGERGAKLSGGEKQRLAFARIFFQDPKIIILDEPISALDSATEEFITNNMLEIFKDRTLIVVAHRLQTVKNIDNILVFEKGKIIQQGRFNDLINQPGKFKELWESQTQNHA
jgi:ABC-type multidrug transport system fused ATPase/permease subunit